MAVGADHVAFGDLGFESLDRQPAANHVRDVVLLDAAAVIELQDHKIRFPAVGARMHLQVRPNVVAGSSEGDRPTNCSPVEASLFVRFVMRPHGRAVALDAVRIDVFAAASHPSVKLR